MKKKIILIISYVLMAFIGIAAYSSAGETCDLNGEWNVSIEHYGALQGIGTIKGDLMIVQKGNKFVAKSTKDTEYSKKGTKKIKGRLGENGIKKALYNRPDVGWIKAKGEINNNCDKLIFDDREAVKVILEKK